MQLRLLSIVAAANDVVYSCDLEAPLAKSQLTISHHTRTFAYAGLLLAEKRDRWPWWRVESSRRGAARVRVDLGG